MRLHSSFQSDNLLIEHYELFLYHHVFVVVSEKPARVQELADLDIESLHLDVPNPYISCALFLDNLRGNTQQNKADSEESELYA